jgi:hypothetical protein
VVLAPEQPTDEHLPHVVVEHRFNGCDNDQAVVAREATEAHGEAAWISSDPVYESDYSHAVEPLDTAGAEDGTAQPFVLCQVSVGVTDPGYNTIETTASNDQRSSSTVAAESGSEHFNALHTGTLQRLRDSIGQDLLDHYPEFTELNFARLLSLK